MENKVFLKLFVIICLMTIVCLFGKACDVFAKDRVYSGVVMDPETTEPIEGAIVVATWLQELIMPPVKATYDVQETLTDRYGRWLLSISEGKIDKSFLEFIPQTGKTIPEVIGPHFIVFKPGYCSCPEGFSVSICREKMKPIKEEGFLKNDITIELPQLTSSKDRRRALPELIHGGKEIYIKERKFIGLINAERRYLGLPEYEDLKEFEE